MRTVEQLREDLMRIARMYNFVAEQLDKQLQLENATRAGSCPVTDRGALEHTPMETPPSESMADARRLTLDVRKNALRRLDGNPKHERLRIATMRDEVARRNERILGPNLNLVSGDEHLGAG